MNSHRLSLPLWFSVLTSLGFWCLSFSASGAQWMQTTSLPDGYQEHALTYASGFLYNSGGGTAAHAELDGTNVFYSQVYADGTIGPWNHATSLPEAVFEHASVAADGFVYVIAGTTVNAAL